MRWAVHAASMVEKNDNGKSENIKICWKILQGLCLMNYFKGNGNYVYHLLHNIKV
jgi:hypothetical protein